MPALKAGWLWEDLKLAAERAKQFTAEFWRGRPDAAEHGRCIFCGNPAPHRHDF